MFQFLTGIMKPLNIMIILPSLAGGGAEKVILSFVDNLDRINFKPTLVIQNKIGPLKTNLDDNNIIYLNTKNFRYAITKLIKVIRLNKPDIIISTLFLIIKSKTFISDIYLYLYNLNNIFK